MGVDGVVTDSLFIAYRILAVPFEHQIFHIIRQVGYSAGISERYRTGSVCKIGSSVTCHHIEIHARKVTLIASVLASLTRIKHSAAITGKRTGSQMTITVCTTILARVVLSVRIVTANRIHLDIRREHMVSIAFHRACLAKIGLRHCVLFVPSCSASRRRRTRLRGGIWVRRINILHRLAATIIEIRRICAGGIDIIRQTAIPRTHIPSRDHCTQLNTKCIAGSTIRLSVYTRIVSR